MQHPDDFLSNARTESHPHLLNVWDKLITDEESGLLCMSQKTSKSTKCSEETRQRIADSLFIASINFQKRKRKESVRTSAYQLRTERGKTIDLHSEQKILNYKILNLLEGVFEEDKIENRLIEMIKIHRGRVHFRAKVRDNIREKLARQESNTEISSGETDGSAGNSKRSRIVCDGDEAQDDPVVKKQKLSANRMICRQSKDLSIYSKDLLRKAEDIRHEMLAEIILKWGLYDAKHMKAARRIETKHMKRLVVPKLTLEKFYGGRFFPRVIETKYIPQLRQEKKMDPNYTVIPIVARDLKHVKGHFSFSSIERDIRNKPPADNWTIREYVPQLKKGLDKMKGSPVNDNSIGFHGGNSTSNKRMRNL
eukprot:g8543.t1